MNKTLISAASLSAFFMPVVAMAQTGGTDIADIIGVIGNIINLLIPLVIALALLAFFYGLVTYIWKSGDAEAHEQGRNIMIAGIVGLFVMVSVWGLVSVLNSTFTINQTGANQVTPGVQKLPGR